MVYSDFNYGEVQSVKAFSLSFSFISFECNQSNTRMGKKKMFDF